MLSMNLFLGQKEMRFSSNSHTIFNVIALSFFLKDKLDNRK